jgi:hypothetical protein
MRDELTFDLHISLKGIRIAKKAMEGARFSLLKGIQYLPVGLPFLARKMEALKSDLVCRWQGYFQSKS